MRRYFRLQLSLRDIEELLFERDVIASYETIRRHFAPERHLLPASPCRKHLAARFSTWRESTDATQNRSAASNMQVALAHLVNLLH